MKFVWPSVFALIAFFASCAAKGHEVRRLACNVNKLCSEADRAIWLNKRKCATNIVEILRDNPQLEIYSTAFINNLYTRLYKEEESTLSPLRADVDEDDIKQRMVLGIREELCSDKQTAGYLLNNESDTWPLACLWTGSDINGICSPAPPTPTNFDFVNANEWKDKVRDFRKTIKCTNPEIQAVEYINELYVCRAGCLQAGVNYMFALFIMLSMLLVVGALCF